MLTLYYSSGACSLGPHISLIENNLPFQLKKVNLKEHKIVDNGDLIKINPKNYVPALQMDNGEILTEACAILFYIAEHGTLAKPLADNKNMLRYRLLEALSFVSSELHKSFGPFFDTRMPEESRVIAREKLTKRLNFLESVLQKNKYLIGDHFSGADAYCFVVLRWIKVIDMGLPLGNWPVLADYYAKMLEMPAIRQALETEHLTRY